MATSFLPNCCRHEGERHEYMIMTRVSLGSGYDHVAATSCCSRKSAKLFKALSSDPISVRSGQGQAQRNERLLTLECPHKGRSLQAQRFEETTKPISTGPLANGTPTLTL